MRFILLGAILCIVLFNQISAQCLCASKGMDFCSCGSTPNIRPVPKPVPRLPSAKFPPIGDSCYCGKQVVEPAKPPKPVCKNPAAPCKCSCNCAHGAHPHLSMHLPAPTCSNAIKQPAVIVKPGVPADPLSISMALTAGKSFGVPEAKLSYGPVAAPLNAVQKIYYSNVPEEKLYGLNAQVIEFKKKFPQPTKAELLAEAIEDLEEEEADVAAAPAPYLTYSDLGYGPAMIKNPLFMRLKSMAQPTLHVGIKPHLTGCGFVPGKIMQASEYLEKPLEHGAPCL